MLNDPIQTVFLNRFRVMRAMLSVGLVVACPVLWGRQTTPQQGTGGEGRNAAGQSISGSPMEFSDKPNFSVAGVTDWTAVGGHGSDATLRTSEDLNRETAALKAQAAARKTHPGGDGNSAADLHRLAGESAEAHGDAVTAVQQEQLAAQMDGSEQNYLTWGSELLLHRAIWQAAGVFAKGVQLHPASARLKTAWGSALFAAARYDEAAQRLCEASDLAPSNREPYLFMGKAALAAPVPLPCVPRKLKRFLALQPKDAEANFYNAMLLVKHGSLPERARATALLTKAVVLNPKFADAYLQLGILSLSGKQDSEAIAYFTKAIEADPKQAEAHYRLGVVYDRTGDANRAKQEFLLHDQIDAANAAAIEQQRQGIKQFLVVTKDRSPAPVTP